MDLSVKYDTLQLSQQLIDRQATTHLPNIKSFLDEWCHMELGGAIGAGRGSVGKTWVGKALKVPRTKGVLFALFIPVNETIVSTGLGAVELLTKCHQGVADKLTQTVDAYAEADKAAYEALSSALQSVGATAPPFEDPRDSPAQLGEATTKAGALYGGADPIAEDQIRQGFQEAGQYADTLKDRAKQRVADATTSDRSVKESQDASSYLVTPEAPDNEMENIRWSAGVVAGSIDWFIEKVFGISLLNDIIFKYVVGDWRLVNMAETAWTEIGDALVAVGQNDSETLPALAEWTGEGSELASAFIAALSLATTKLSAAAGFMSTLLKVFGFFLKEAAKDLGETINKLVNSLLRKLAEASIPVAGWATAALDSLISFEEDVAMIRRIYMVVNFIVDAIEGFVRGKAQMVEVANTMSNLAEAAARGVAARA